MERAAAPPPNMERAFRRSRDDGVQAKQVASSDSRRIEWKRCLVIVLWRRARCVKKMVSVGCVACLLDGE
jgi:hypothetical protein